MKRLAWASGMAAIGFACSSPALEGTTFSCATDADCTGEKVCGKVSGTLGCIVPNTSPIRVGMSGPLQGPSQGLGIEMRRGMQAMFKDVNDGGGVFGRRFELECMNDNYDPDTAYANVRQLLDVQQDVADPDMPDMRGPNGVLALLGNVGTPPMLKTAPLATKNRVVFFAPFTGAQKYLRDGTNSPFVFNYRAGYYEETQAMIDYMATFRTPRIIVAPQSYKHILAFTQNDSYGNAGYDGLVHAYNTTVAAVPQPDSSAPNPSIARVTYERENVSSVEPAIIAAEEFFDTILGEGQPDVTPVAIVMIDTYEPGNKFVRAVKDWVNADLARASKLDLLFIHVSFVGSDSLAKALASAPETYVDVTDRAAQRKVAYATGVMVTQVVPYYHSQAPAITAYRTDIGKSDGGAYTFTSLEGYIAARLFVEAVRINGRDLDDESLVTTLNSRIRNLDIGIGTLLSFSSTSNQASHTVWGSMIGGDGSFTVPFAWNPTDRIVPGSN